MWINTEWIYVNSNSKIGTLKENMNNKQKQSENRIDEGTIEIDNIKENYIHLVPNYLLMITKLI